MRMRHLVGLVFLMGLSLCNAQPLAIANGGLTGQWFDPNRSGEGYFVEIVDVEGVPTIAVSWFTYDSAGNQMWLVGSAPIGDGATRVEVPIFVTQGPVFGPEFDPDDLQLIEWGTLTFEFTSCNSGVVDYASTLGFGNGSIEITRLTSILDFACQLPPPPADVFPGIWRVGDRPTVCFNVSADGQRLSRIGSGCGRPAPLGHTLSVEDTFNSEGKQCTVDFQFTMEVEIVDNRFEIVPQGSSFPLLRGEFLERTRAQLIYDDRQGCRQTYALSPIR